MLKTIIANSINLSRKFLLGSLIAGSLACSSYKQPSELQALKLVQEEIASEEVYSSILEGIDSLVTRVNRYEDVADENNKKFEPYITDFLSGEGEHFFIRDNVNPFSRRINLLVNVQGQGKNAYYSSMAIPNPQK